MKTLVSYDYYDNTRIWHTMKSDSETYCGRRANKYIYVKEMQDTFTVTHCYLCLVERLKEAEHGTQE